MLEINNPKTNKIFSIILFIIMTYLLIDIIILYNIYVVWHGVNTIYKAKYIRLGIDSLVLIVLFYLTLFLKAKKGKLLLYKDNFPNNFPFKIYFIISLIITFILELGFWLLRIIMTAGFFEYGFIGYFIISLLILFSYVIIFGILMLSFYFSYLVAKHQMNLKNKQ